MADLDELQWLERWYLSQCNGNWEHGYGVSINTLDNPGWSVKLNLIGTPFAGLKHDPFDSQIAEDNWMICSIVDGEFRGYGDPSKLKSILSIVREWLSTGSSREDQRD